MLAMFLPIVPGGRKERSIIESRKIAEKSGVAKYRYQSIVRQELSSVSIIFYVTYYIHHSIFVVSMLRPAFVTTFSAAPAPLTSYTSSSFAELVSSTTTNDNNSLSTTIIRSTSLSSSITMASIPSTSAYSPPDTNTRVFEAIGPDPSVLGAFGIVVLVCIAAGYVWANDVVPVSRTKLAISKNRGDVRDYLDSLRPEPLTVTEEVDDRVEGMQTILDGSAHQQLVLSSTTTTTLSDAGDGDSSSSIVTTTKEQQQRRNDNNIIVKPNVGDGRDFERWLFTDWLNKPNMNKGGRQKEPALPILKDAKWNSGDNPVLVTAAIMMLVVVVASITERIAT